MKSVLLALLLTLPNANPVAPELQSLFEQARYQQLLHSLQQQPQPVNVELGLLQARALIQQQQREEANTLLNQLVLAHPDHSRLLTLAALNKVALANSGTLFQARKRATDALDLLLRAIEVAPTDHQAQQALITFYQTAPANVGGSKALAKEHAAALLKQHPVQGTLALVTIAMHESRTNEALQLLDQQLKLTPESSELMLRKAHILSQQRAFLAAQELYVKALPLIQDIVQQQNTQFQIGRLAVFTGQYIEQGVVALEQYIAFFAGSQQPRLPRAKLRLAQLYVQQGKIHQARALYLQIAEVLSEEPDFLEARAALGSQVQQ